MPFDAISQNRGLPSKHQVLHFALDAAHRTDDTFDAFVDENRELEEGRHEVVQAAEESATNQER